MQLITKPEDVSYLLNMQIDPNDHVSLLIAEDKKYILCNALTSEHMHTHYTDWDIFDTREAHQETIKNLESMTIDPDDITVSRLQQLKEIQPNIHYKTNPIKERRKKKSPEEIEKIIQSQRINEQVLTNTLPKIQKGITEKQVEQIIKMQYLQLGASGWGFDPIVAFGEHTINPHHKNSDTPLQKGEHILIDMGCIVDGYHSDMTRMIFTDTLTDIQNEIFQLLLQAHETSMYSIQIGMRGCDIWDYGKGLLGEYGSYFTHCWGHGVGREIHESPALLPSREDLVEEGDVITIEPGIYIPNSIGMRHENIAYMHNGKLEKITEMPDLIQIEI